MALKIGRNKNTNDEANVVDAIGLNSATSTTILPPNPNRIAVSINNDSENNGVWIKLEPASANNTKKGIWLPKRSEGPLQWNMLPDNVYTGEISAIAATGTPDVYITEY